MRIFNALFVKPSSKRIKTDEGAKEVAVATPAEVQAARDAADAAILAKYSAGIAAFQELVNEEAAGQLKDYLLNQSTISPAVVLIPASDDKAYRTKVFEVVNEHFGELLTVYTAQRSSDDPMKGSQVHTVAV